MRRLLSILTAVGACAAAVFLAGASGERGEDTKTYRIVFDNAFGLVEGGDFRVGGVRAGKTVGLEVTRGYPPKAVVTAEIEESGFGDFRADASCDIKPQSLIGEYFVDCQPGSSGEKLPEGGTVPVGQTSSTIPADLVNNILRRPYRERFRLIVTTLGTGLAGRPEDLGEALRRAHPGLRETSRVLRILGDQNQVIKDFIGDSDRVMEELERNKRDVVRWVDEAGDTAEITATRRGELRRTFEKLPGFLDELRPTMRRLGELADEQTPLLADLRRAAPSLDELFTRLGPFSEASRPAVDSLGELSRVGARAFRKGREEVARLRALAPKAQPAFRPLRQFLETSDDRGRALEDDPRAKNGGPPAPDPTAIPEDGAGGFTGLEALWNYFFWQSLSINGYDSISHMLRVAILESKCGELHTEFDLSDPKQREEFEHCSQWLGPNLPGITTPDFSEGPQAAALRRAADRPASRVGERRSAGLPDAGPLPGQPDISQPQVVLPPAVQELLDSLTPRERRRLDREELERRLRELPPLEAPALPAPVPAPTPAPAPRGDEGPTQLLDFLLAP